MNKIALNLSFLLSLAIASGLVRTAQATLLVQYTFDEASSGNGTALNTGTLGASANGTFDASSTRTSNTPGGVSLGALNLNPTGGVGGVGPTSDIPALDAPTQLTVATWVNVQGNNIASDPSYRSLVSDFSSSSLTGWLFSYNVVGGNQSNMDLAFQVNHGAGHDVVASTPVSASNTWVFVAMTWDSTTGNLNFYSGTPASVVAQVGSTLSQTNTLTASGVPLVVGNDNFGSTPNAFMDDVRIYNSVLTSSQLDAVRLQGVTSVPEPSSVLLLACGAAGLVCAARRKAFLAAATVR